MKTKREHKELPWDTWDLDKKFFNDLHRYSKEHPESTLDRVLDSVKDGLETNKELFELVPENPFPARGLVKALAHLIKLGITVTRAKAAVQQFSETVVSWVLDVKATFLESRGEKFTWATWRHLSKMRDLINEICLWATTRLNDRRWTRLSGGMKIGSEIADFNARIAEAKELFRDLSIITFASGIDAILAALRLLLRRQDGITAEIKKIRRDQIRQMDYLIDEMEARKQKEERRAFLANTLIPVTVSNPTYTEQGKLPCDEGTRVAVLAEIMDWIKDVSSTSQSFLWLSGDPGCGKSAITASIARECKDRGTLWAQFFINRNNEETTNPNLYFPSIAQQLISRSADVEVAVYDTLKAKPSLLDRITPEQAAKLFIDSIAVATTLDPKKPVVIVIDGLDETDHKCLRDTATIFTCLFRGLAPFPNAKLFLSSRTEDDIRNPFAKNMMADQVKHIHLDTSAQSSIDDVAIFLRRKLEQIVEENDLNWTLWPGERRMQALAARASGLFIWAVTVSNFLQQQVNALGTECLDDILNILSGDALGDINTLYGVILRLTYQGHTDSWEFEKFRRIIGAILTLRERLSLRDISALLDLRRTPSSSPVDLVKFVQRLRTVLVAGTEAVDQNTVPRVHKSFYEFVTSPSPEPHFQVPANVAEAELSVACFKQLSGFYALSPQILPRHLIYAYQHWSSHLQAAVGTKRGVLFLSDAMDLTALTKHLPIMRSNRNTPPFHTSFSSDYSTLNMASPRGVLSWDLETGKQQVVTTIQAPTGGVNSIDFSKSGSCLLYGCAGDPKVAIHDVQKNTRQNLGILNLARLATVSVVSYYRARDTPKLGEGLFAVGCVNGEVRLWVPEAQQLVPFHSMHSSRVLCLAFSYSGEVLLSGSADGRVISWNLDYPRLSQQDNSLVVHNKPIIFVKALRDRTVIAVASDGTIFFRHLPIAQATGPKVEAPEDQVSLTQRLYRDIICAGVHDSPLRTHVFVGLASGGGLLLDLDVSTAWEGKNRRIKTWATRELSASEYGTIRCCAFSQGENLLALGCDSGLIHMIDHYTLKHVESPKTYRHSSGVTALAFSQKHDLLAAVSKSVVRIWRCGEDSGPSPGSSLPQSPGPWTTTFSPDQRMVAAISPTALHLWDLKNLNTTSLLSSVDNIEIRALSFSPVGSRLVGVSTYGMYVWDAISHSLLASASQMFPSPTVSIAFHFDDPSSRFLTIEEGRLARNMTWSLEDRRLTRTKAAVDCDDYASFSPLLKVSNQPITFPGFSDTRFYPATPTSTDGLWVYLENSLMRIREDGSMSVVPVEMDATFQTLDTEEMEED